MGCILPRVAVVGEGEGGVGVGRFTGERENSFCRETIPSLVEGKLISEGPIFAKVGPKLIQQTETLSCSSSDTYQPRVLQEG